VIARRGGGRSAVTARPRDPGIRRALALTAVAAVLLVGCGSGNDAGVVTMTTKVPASLIDRSSGIGATGEPSTPQPSTPQPSTLPNITPQPSTPGTQSVRSPAGAGLKPSSAASMPRVSAQRSSAPSKAGTSPARTPKSGEPSTGATAPTRLPPASQIPTANAAPVSPETPGPETGPKCAANAAYVDEQPTGLRSDVIRAWRNVEKYANADGIIVCLNDGKRSRAQQQAQYDQYLKQYGKQAADQLVLTPDKSSHVTGIAIDVQPAAAFRWLQATKGALGLCRTFDNEGWHFEYDVSYFKGCPPRKPRPEH